MRPGLARRDLHRRKVAKLLPDLRNVLSRFDSEPGFLRLVWAVDMLQSEMRIDVRSYLEYPAGAESLSPDAPYRVNKWELEALVACYFNTPPSTDIGRSRPTYNSGNFAAMCRLVNLLRAIENAESGMRLTPHNVLQELHRIAHRQFEWQRNFATGERLYRFAFIYGQGQCAEYFESRYQLSLVEFLHAGFLLFAQCHRWPWKNVTGLKGLGVSEIVIEKALNIMARSLHEFRNEAVELHAALFEGKNVPLAYQPSLLRRYPIISDPNNGRYLAPLPELIMYRMTVGLFYEIAGGPQELLNEANSRFEDYAMNLLQGYLRNFDVMPSLLYGGKKNRIDTPDILVAFRGEISIAIECKATKLTYPSQYSNDPMHDAKKGFNQIAKGVAQLWRFFAHARIGRFTEYPVSQNAYAIVLTLDAWMQMSADLQDEVTAIAKALVSTDPEVIDADMRPIIFCPMQEFADTTIISNEEQFLSTLANAVTPEYRGWGLREVRRRTDPTENANPFPFDYAALLPWMGTLNEQARRTGGSFF